MKGFSIIEVGISVSILALLSAGVRGAFSIFRDTRELDRASSDVLNFVREARSRTLASENDSQFGVHFESDRAVLFRGAAYVEGAADNEIYLLPPRVEVYSITIQGNNVVFERLTGNASVSGTVAFRLKSAPSKISTLFIQSTGLIYAQ